jgi:hypothetical protein
MNSVYIAITDLTFPANLEDKYCKFRPVVSLRYKDSNDKATYAREVLPGLGKRDYWECEKDNKNKDGYVRHDTLPKVDMENKLDISKREIQFDDLDIKSFERIEVEIFDIDIKVGWEVTVSKLATLIPPDAAALLIPGLPPTFMLVKAAVEKATGKNVKDLEKSLISKLIGKEDGAARSIFARSQKLENPPQTEITLSGPGTQGDYSVSLEIEVS